MYKNSRAAQLVPHLIFNLKIVGSNPGAAWLILRLQFFLIFDEGSNPCSNPCGFFKLHIYGYGAYHMLYSFLGGWVPRDDGCCTLFQVGGSPDGGKGTVTYLPWERNATQCLELVLGGS